MSARGSGGAWADLAGLSARERDVVEHVLRGMTTQQIAAQLCLSPYTVQDHLKAVFRKTGLPSRRQLVAALSHASTEAPSLPA